MKPWLKIRNHKLASANIFSELPLTDRFRHYSSNECNIILLTIH